MPRPPDPDAGAAGVPVACAPGVPVACAAGVPVIDAACNPVGSAEGAHVTGAARIPDAGTAPGLLARARRVARDAWRAPDRLLHAHRREATLARLHRGPTPRRILFICHGNIFRSPFAEHLAAARLPPALRGRVDVASAGFVGPGRPSPTEAVEAARLWGIDLAPHRSRRLTAEEASRAGLVVVMDPRQRRGVRRLGCPARNALVLGDLDPDPVATREIVDPFGRPAIVLLESYRRIARCVDALLRALAAADGARAGRRAGRSDRTARDPDLASAGIQPRHTRTGGAL